MSREPETKAHYSLKPTHQMEPGMLPAPPEPIRNNPLAESKANRFSVVSRRSCLAAARSTLSIPPNQHSKQQTDETCSKNYRNDVPLPSGHADKGGYAGNDSEPIYGVCGRENDMQPKPDG